MSARIDFSGDDLAGRVPMFGEFKDTLMSVIDPLTDVAACRWADGVPADDHVTLQARDGVRGMITEYLYPGYGVLGESVGAQGDKMDKIIHDSDEIEDDTTTASDWGSRRG